MILRVWSQASSSSAAVCSIAAGLFTRIAAFFTSGEMAVAYFKAHASRSFWPILSHGELAVLYCFVFLYIVFRGGGEWSLDSLRSRHA
jgi:putative oxidoreductase